NPLLQIDELDLQMGKLFAVLVVLRWLAWLRAACQMPILLDLGRFLRIGQNLAVAFRARLLSHGLSPLIFSLPPRNYFFAAGFFSPSGTTSHLPRTSMERTQSAPASHLVT